jgi:hypothetical protein
MFFKNKNGQYLAEGNEVSERHEEAILIEEEIVGNGLLRFKIQDQYICFLQNSVILNDVKDDTSLIVHRGEKYINLSGNYLHLSDKLCELITENNELEPDFIVEHLELEEKIVYKFKKYGIASWKLSEFELDANTIDKVRNQILENPNSRIGQVLAEVKDSEMFLKIPTLKSVLDLILKEYHLTTFSSNTLRKDIDGRGFHVDYPYHDLKEPYPDEILGVQVNFALDDFTKGNGATIYIPESYKSHCFPRGCDVSIKEKKYMLAPKGSVILYRGDMWHSQGINVTDNPRVALLANFSPLHIPAKDRILLGDSGLNLWEGKVII